MPKVYKISNEGFRSRRNRLLAKRDKVDMMRLCLSAAERTDNPDVEYINDLKRRLAENEQQLKVMSK